jgi:hypothetical protein
VDRHLVGLADLEVEALVDLVVASEEAVLEVVVPQEVGKNS